VPIDWASRVCSRFYVVGGVAYVADVAPLVAAPVLFH
jgi:hypothetical protein